MKLALFLIASVLLTASSSAPQDATPPRPVVKKPLGASGPGQDAKTQILYHGGPVMNATNSVYVIYYGTGFAQSTQPIINDFLSALSGSPEYGVNHTYNEGPNTSSVPTTYNFMPPATPTGSGASNSVYWDEGSQGSQLSGNSIPKIVANAISNGLAADTSGIYFVVTSPDIKVSGFCNSFCAYHTDATVALASGENLHIRYALIPDPTQRCTSCNGGIAVYGDTVTPNGDMGADTMTDDIMHELSETVTDPDISAWYTQNGQEDGDLCNYVYGPLQSGRWTPGTVGTGTNSAGATYHFNAELMTPWGSTRRYLVQQIWKNVGTGACSAY